MTIIELLKTNKRKVIIGLLAIFSLSWIISFVFGETKITKAVNTPISKLTLNFNDPNLKSKTITWSKTYDATSEPSFFVSMFYPLFYTLDLEITNYGEATCYYNGWVSQIFVKYSNFNKSMMTSVDNFETIITDPTVFSPSSRVDVNYNYWYLGNDNFPFSPINGSHSNGFICGITGTISPLATFDTFEVDEVTRIVPPTK